MAFPIVLIASRFVGTPFSILGRDEAMSASRPIAAASVLRSAQVAALHHQRPDDDAQGIGHHVIP